MFQAFLKKHESLPQQMPTSVRVLIVDDDSLTLSAVEYLMRRNGYAVTSARSGEACLQALAEQSYDLVLLDIHMAGMDGISTLAQIKRNSATARIPVVMITKARSAELMRRCKEVGADAVLQKATISPSVLNETVRRLLADEDIAEPEPYLPEDRQLSAVDLDERIAQLPTFTSEQTLAELSHTLLPHIFSGVKQEIRFATGTESDELVWAILQDPPSLCALLSEGNKKTSSSGSIKQIIDLLTVQQVQQMAIQLKSPIIDPAHTVWAHRWWRHALAVARIASAIAPNICIDPEVAAAAGVLHDIGRLLLLQSPLGDTAEEVYDLSRNMGMPVTQIEQVVFGMDHAQIGAHFCETAGLPNWAADVCLNHSGDGEHAGRDEMSFASQKQLSDLIAASNAVAKALGYGSLPNDEIQPLPSSMLLAFDRNQDLVDKAISRVQTTCRWRMGNEMPPSRLSAVDATNINVAFLSTDPSRLNPYRRVLSNAGASVYTFDHASRGRPLQPDIILLDHTNCRIVDSMPSLRRLGQAYRNTPILLLARRSEDPRQHAETEDLNIHVYPTPIRTNTLLQIVRKLSRPQTGDMIA